jgi:hypothetical protein
MKRFANELFSIQLDPPKGESNGHCVTYGLFEGGLFTVRTSAPYSEEAENAEAQAFYAKDPKDQEKIAAFIAKWKEKLHDIPEATGVNENGVSTFNFVLDGQEVYGNYHRLDLDEAKSSGQFDASQLKMIEWNNRVVNLVEDFFTLVQSLNTNQLAPAINVPELDYLRPAPRYLMSLVLNDPECHIALANEREEAIKAAARRAFEGEEALDGKSYNEVFMGIKVNALAILEKAKSMKEFDQAHSALVKNLISKSFNKLDYAHAAYWLDLSYLYFLLSKEWILSESKVAYLHAPIAPHDLAEEEKSDDEAAYLFFQEEGRKEFALLHISPIYFYLEGIFSKAHPAPTSNISNKA